MLVNCKKGISSYELGKALGVSQKSAWFMLHRLRLALQKKTIARSGDGEGSTIEADETFVGGRVKNMHASKSARSGRHDGTMAMGMLDRNQRKVRALVVPNVRPETLQVQILAHIAPKSEVFTDQANAYTEFPEGTLAMS